MSDTPVIHIPATIESTEQAQKLMQFRSFANQVVGRVDDLLKDWVADHGPVYTMGQVAEFRPGRETWEPDDLATVAKVLVSAGIPKDEVWSTMGLTKTALTKLLKKHKLADSLDTYLDMGTISQAKDSFGIYKDKTI